MVCSAELNHWLGSSKFAERNGSDHNPVQSESFSGTTEAVWAALCFLLHIQCLEVLAVKCLSLWAFQKWVGGFYNSRVGFFSFYFFFTLFLKADQLMSLSFHKHQPLSLPPASVCPHRPKFLCSLYASQVVWRQKLHCMFGYIVTSLSSFFNY